MSLQAIEQLLDPILDVVAGAVDPFMEEARIVARLAVTEPDDVGLDCGAAVAVPRADRWRMSA